MNTLATIASAVPVSAFDYSALAPDVAQMARKAAQRLRDGHKRMTQEIIAIGAELIAVKERLEHGQFGAWLDAEFGAHARTARNCMMAAEQFADKSETVSVLPTATVYKLAAPATPDTVRQEVVKRP